LRFRVFAALELPPENQQRLGEVLADLQAAAPPGAVRWVRPETIHLTVKFYGDVDDGKRPAVEAALAEAAARAQPMRLSMAGLGVFPHPRRPQVVWAGVAGDLAELLELQREVEVRSAALGFAPESRAYSPHLTLGRVNGGLRPEAQLRLLGRLEARRAEVFGPLAVEALSLMRSDLQPTGAVYTRLYVAPLGAAQRWTIATQE
jgi:2'-5' RNA ligase